MSKLSAFLHPVTTQEEKEVFVSKRFVKRDEAGNPVLGPDGNPIPEPFKIRPLTQEEIDRISKQSTRRSKEGGKYTDTVDSAAFTRSVIVAATVSPDFRDAELCSAYGVLDPAMVAPKMLNPGEYSRLLKEIMAASGFDDLEDDVKN